MKPGYDGTVKQWGTPRPIATPGWFAYPSKHKVAHCSLCEHPWGSGMVFYAPVIITADGQDLTRHEPCPQCRKSDGTPVVRDAWKTGRRWVFWDYTCRYGPLDGTEEAQA